MKVMCVKANHCVTEDHDRSRMKVMAVEYVQFSYFCSSEFFCFCSILSLSLNYKSNFFSGLRACKVCCGYFWKYFEQYIIYN